MGAFFRWLRNLVAAEVGALGQRVLKASVDMPATTGTIDLFTVAGGRVRLTSLVGQVTTIIASTATNVNVKVTHVATVGGPTDLSAVYDVFAGPDDEDCIYTIDGTPGNAMLSDSEAGVAAASMSATDQVLMPGVVTLDIAEVAGVAGALTGATKWTLHWIPLDVGATVVSA